MKRRNNCVRVTISLVIVCTVVLIGIMIFQAMQAKSLQENEIYRACQDHISYAYSVPEVNGDSNNLSIVTYYEKEGEYYLDENATELIQLYATDIERDQYNLKLELVPLKQGELYYEIYSAGDLVLSDHYKITHPSLFFSLKKIISALFWQPLKSTILAPVVWLLNNAPILSALSQKLQMLDQLLAPVILFAKNNTVWFIVLAVLAVAAAIALLVLLCKMWIKFHPRKTGVWVGLNTYVMCFSVSFFLIYARWYQSGYLHRFLGCSETTIRYTLITWAFLFCVTLCIFGVCLVRRKFKPTILIWILCTTVFFSAILYSLIALAVISFVVSCCQHAEKIVENLPAPGEPRYSAGEIDHYSLSDFEEIDKDLLRNKYTGEFVHVHKDNLSGKISGYDSDGTDCEFD